MYSAARAHRYSTTTPLSLIAASPAVVWTDGVCEQGDGSMAAALDGAPIARGLVLPIGSHTYSVGFSNCLVDGLDGIRLTGTTTLRYSTADWLHVSVNVATASMRATGRVGLFDSLQDVTATGSGTWTVAATSRSYADTYLPGAGATLVNNRTTNVITFKGGSLLHVRTGDPNAPESIQNGFANLAIDLNGVEYVLDGTQQTAVVNRVVTASGEIRITSAGVLVGRIFQESGGPLRAIALAPIVTF